MKYKNLFWGVILILLGILYLLKQLDVIWFNWRDIVSLWPLLLVLWGISILPVKPLYKFIASFVAILAMVLIISFTPGRWHSGWIWFGDHYRTESKESKSTGPLDESSALARLELDAAAGKYTISGTTDELVDFTHIGDSGTYFMRTSVEGNMHHVHIGPEYRGKKFSLYHSHEVEVKLNPGLRWELDIDAGAADITLDLAGFIVDKLKIEGGATSMEIILGSRSDYVEAEIETGVSSVLIKVPEEMACEVNTDSFLVSRELPGFDKVSKSTYVSPNFSETGKNISIKFNSGISSLRVIRY